MSKKDKKQIYKPRPISGFPEWLPEVRAVEQSLGQVRLRQVGPVHMGGIQVATREVRPVQHGAHEV